MFIHHERYKFATLRGFSIRTYYGGRRVFIHTKHHALVIGW